LLPDVLDDVILIVRPDVSMTMPIDAIYAFACVTRSSKEHCINSE
jgi:hypothetical protein